MDYVLQLDFCQRLRSWLISPGLEDDRATQMEEDVPDSSAFGTPWSSYTENSSTKIPDVDHNSDSSRNTENIQMDISHDSGEGQNSPQGETDLEGMLHHTESGEGPQRPLAVFTPFGRLPAELRIRIWKLNLPEPRTITPHPDYVSEDVHGQGVLSPLFDACFESKDIISKIYPLCFGDQLLGNTIRFSPIRDTIIFHSYRIMKDFYPHSWYGIYTLTRSERQAFVVIKHLVVHYDFLLGLVLPFVERFENLETLVVEGKSAWDPTANPPAVDEQAFMDRLRLLARKRGNGGNVPLVAFRIAG
ncbi:hypothetical protein DL98DRAFT_587786 [Cadophora sp. DSE1049]|nr:hypothetical protein DL98DRAFT_587786 [Cadophora sp. DSE1049]